MHDQLKLTEVGVLRIFLYMALGLSLFATFRGTEESGRDRDWGLYAVVALAGLAASAANPPARRD